MKILKDFKEFAMKGNVIDLAVGIIIGAAFGKIISSLVNDLIMPPIGLLVGGIDFKEIVVNLKEAVKDPATGKILKEAVTLKIGNFIQTVVDFLIVAFAIFMMVKAITNLNRKKTDSAPVAPPPPTKDQELLSEIRDLLKKGQGE
ncbi:MAG: large-conductance mechanosensitive channel protein MscL [Bacteroidota bacterium]